MHNYPTFDSLGIAPDYLWIGAYVDYVCGISHVKPRAVRASPDPLPEEDQPARCHDTTRTYQSEYVGVTIHAKTRYVAQWGGGGRSRGKGAVRPLTMEGERAAAVERARALGRDYLERRDGKHEPLEGGEI